MSTEDILANFSYIQYKNEVPLIIKKISGRLIKSKLKHNSQEFYTIHKDIISKQLVNSINKLGFIILSHDSTNKQKKIIHLPIILKYL